MKTALILVITVMGLVLLKMGKPLGGVILIYAACAFVHNLTTTDDVPKVPPTP